MFIVNDVEWLDHLDYATMTLFRKVDVDGFWEAKNDHFIN